MLRFWREFFIDHNDQDFSKILSSRMHLSQPGTHQFHTNIYKRWICHFNRYSYTLFV